MICSECTMTFAERLKYKADMYRFESDVNDNMSGIQKKMEEAYYAREYIIELIKPHAGADIAFGGTKRNYSIVFVPAGITLKGYCDLMLNALRALGFNGINTNVDIYSYPRYDSCKIIVRWQTWRTS